MGKTLALRPVLHVQSSPSALTLRHPSRGTWTRPSQPFVQPPLSLFSSAHKRRLRSWGGEKKTFRKKRNGRNVHVINEWWDWGRTEHRRNISATTAQYKWMNAIWKEYKFTSSDGWRARAHAQFFIFFFPFLCPSVNWPPVASAPTNQPWKNGLLIIYRLDLTLSVTAAGHLHSSLFYTMVIKSGRVMSVPFTTKWNSVRSFVRFLFSRWIPNWKLPLPRHEQHNSSPRRCAYSAGECCWNKPGWLEFHSINEITDVNFPQRDDCALHF